MNSLTQFMGGEMVWKQPKLGVDHYALHNGKDIYGELYWMKWLTDNAVGLCNGKKYAFSRVVFTPSRVVAYEGEHRTRIADFDFNHSKGGVIRLTDRTSYYWSRKDLIRNIWILETKNEDLLLELEINLRWLKQEAFLNLQTTVEETEKIDLLILMSFYLAVCALRDTQEAAAPTAVADD